MRADISEIPYKARGIILRFSAAIHRIIRAKSKTGIIDLNDLVQAGALGYLVAFRRFGLDDPQFYAKAEVLIKRHIREASYAAYPNGRKIDRRTKIKPGQRIPLNTRLDFREYHIDEPFAPQFDDEDGERVQADRRAIEALSPKQRAIVERRIWGGMTWGEIARETGVSINAAKNRYHTAAKKLQAAAVA